MAEITITEELQIRERLADMINDIAEIDRVIPAPVYFQDHREFWRSINLVSRPGTQTELETTHISCVWISFAGFEDLDENPHSPLFDLRYDIYVFSQYDLERQDENATPEAFARQSLKRHNDFVSSVLKIKGMFQGEINLALLDTAKYARQFTTPVFQDESVINKGPCEFIEEIEGHSVRLQESVRLKFKEC